MKKVFYVILILFVIGIASIGGLLIYVMNSDTKFNPEYPNLKHTTDSSMIARGKYLAFGPAHCASCHMPMDKLMAVEGGLELPLSGGWELSIPPGTFRAPNLTSDKETGIGNLSDGEIARSLRYSVAHDGQIMFPFMPFQEISDSDLVALLSFLRSLPPVNNKIIKSELSIIGKALVTFGALTPVKPTKTPPKTIEIDSTIKYGEYIAKSVANCIGCHTERDLMTGKNLDKDFAGGLQFPPDNLSAGYTFISPNITPDKTTGVMASWNEQSFIKRFKTGRTVDKSPMPWGSFSRMNDLELKALWRYLQTLEPVKKEIKKTVFTPNEQVPS